MSELIDKMNNCYCRSYISQHYEGWETRMFERYDIDNYIETLDNQGADSVIITARTFTGHWYTDLGFGELMPGLKGVDQLQRSIDYFRRTDKLIIAYVTAVYDRDQYDLQPGWRQVDRDGNPLSIGSERVVCMNSPYREYMKYMVTALFRERDIDGMLLDMAFFADKICYCKNCRRKFRTQYLSDIPETDDFNDPVFRNYVKFRRKSNESFTREIFDAIRLVKKDAILYPQYQILKDRGMNSQNLDIAEFSDFIYSDVYFEHGYLPVSVISKVSRTVCSNVPEIGFMTRPGSHNDAPNMKTLDHIRYESFTVLANGCAVHYHDIMWPDGTLQKEMWDRHTVVFDEIKERLEWSDKGKKIAQVAVYYSEENMVWFGRENRTENVKTHLYGAFRALTEAKIDYDIVVDMNPETLERYDCLLLPNVGILSDSECENVRNFVHQGGGLVASGVTSLFNEEGIPRDNFQLEDVFGASRTGDTSTYSRVYTKYDTETFIAENTCEDGMMTSWGNCQKLSLSTGQQLASIVYPYTEPDSERFINSMANPPAVYTDEPACVTNSFGKGNVVYFSSEIEKNYLTTSFPELREIYRNAILHVMPHPLKVEVSNDALIEVNNFQSDQYLYIHLVNGQSNKGISFSEGKPALGRAQNWGSSTYVETREIIQKVIPTFDTEIIVRDINVKSVIQAPEKKSLEFKRIGNDIHITVPKIHYHDIIVLELE